MRKAKKQMNIVFLLDMTGSMFAIRDDTIGGFNSFLEEQQKSENEINFWMTLFNSAKIDKRYVKENINNVKPLNVQTYVPTNSTPLWDAIGNTMQEFSDEKDVMFIVLTDGEENSSTEFNSDTVNKMVEEKEKKLNWKFLYLGADIKDFANATKIGLKNVFTVNKNNMIQTFTSLNRSVNHYVSTGKIKYK